MGRRAGILNNKTCIKAVGNGLVQNLFYVCMELFFFSTFTSSLSIKNWIILGIISAFFNAFVCFALTATETQNKTLALFLLISVSSFVVWFIILSLIINTFFNIPIRIIDNGDGILFLLSFGCHFLESAILNGCVFVVLFIRNALKGRKCN